MLHLGGRDGGLQIFSHYSENSFPSPILERIKEIITLIKNKVVKYIIDFDLEFPLYSSILDATLSFAKSFAVGTVHAQFSTTD